MYGTGFRRIKYSSTLLPVSTRKKEAHFTINASYFGENKLRLIYFDRKPSSSVHWSLLECRKLVSHYYATTTPHDWPKNSRQIFNQSEVKPMPVVSWRARTHFPALRVNYNVNYLYWLQFWLVHWLVCVLCDLLKWSLWFWFLRAIRNKAFLPRYLSTDDTARCHVYLDLRHHCLLSIHRQPLQQDEWLGPLQ